MNDETFGALKRIIKEVKEKRHAECLNKYCVVNQQIGGNDIDLVESWIDEVAKEYQDDDNLEFNRTHTIKEIKEARQAVKDSN